MTDDETAHLLLAAIHAFSGGRADGVDAGAGGGVGCAGAEAGTGGAGETPLSARAAPESNQKSETGTSRLLRIT